MASIEEELVFARQAKAAIEGKLTEQAIEVLREAYRMVGTQPTVSRSLRDARHKVGLALPLVIMALEQGQKNQGHINNAKSAIEDWIKELKGSPYTRR
jgi:hypothetical protein